MFNSLWKEGVVIKYRKLTNNADIIEDVYIAKLRTRIYTPILKLVIRWVKIRGVKRHVPQAANILIVGKAWLKKHLTQEEWASYIADKMSTGISKWPR